MHQQRFTRDLVQYLGLAGAHALAPPRGQNDDFQIQCAVGNCPTPSCRDPRSECTDYRAQRQECLAWPVFQQVASRVADSSSESMR